VAKVLITGGAGNLARYVAAELAPRGHEVVLFDRLAPTQVRFPWEAEHPLVQGELTSLADCERAIRESGASTIVHLGAIPSPTDHASVVARQEAQGFPPLPEDETFRVNVMGTYYLLDAARRHGVERIVAASSYFTIGLGFRLADQPFEADYLPFDEEHPSRPEDSYSLSKLLNEEMYRAYSRAYGIQTVAMRLLRVVYPHRDDPAVVFDVKPPEPLGRDFLTWIEYVDARDAAQAFRLGVEAEGLAPFETFFVGTDVTVRDDPRELVRRLYPDLAAKTRDWRPGDLPISIRKAERMLGYQPRHSWRQPTAATR
jgi:nucleoside-diphosphate-sugar epimerase